MTIMVQIVGSREEDNVFLVIVKLARRTNTFLVINCISSQIIPTKTSERLLSVFIYKVRTGKAKSLFRD